MADAGLPFRYPDDATTATEVSSRRVAVGVRTASENVAAKPKLSANSQRCDLVTGVTGIGDSPFGLERRKAIRSCVHTSVTSSSALVCSSLVIGAEQSLTEAPAGFDTPTLAARPGSESSSNGIAEPPGDSFAQDQQAFETPHDATTGLGPVYNATSCSGCHQNPVTGGPSQITEIRAGHRDENGSFVNPSVSINDGANVISGRSIVNDRAICPQARNTCRNQRMSEACEPC